MNKEEILAEVADMQEQARNAGRALFADRLGKLATSIDEKLVDMEPAD